MDVQYRTTSDSVPVLFAYLCAAENRLNLSLIREARYCAQYHLAGPLSLIVDVSTSH